MLSIVLLIVTFAIIVVMTLMGFRKGFLKTIFRLSPLLIGFVLVYFLSGPVTTTVDDMTNVRENVTVATQNKLYSIVQKEYAENDAEQKAAIEKSFIPDALINSYENCDNFVSELKDDYVTRLSKYAGELAVKLLGAVITVIVGFLIFTVVNYLLGFANKIPIVGGINEIAGGIVGLFFGFLIVSLMFFLITVFSSTDLGGEALAAIKDNAILNFLYNGAFNLINMLL